MELAGRADRLWAAIIDRLFFIAAAAAAAILLPGLRSNSLNAAIGAFAVMFAALLGVQIWLLTAKGQTIGKKVMGLSIVRVADMQNGGFVTNVLLRGAIGWGISAIPVAGVLWGLADPLAIFRDDRRCIHDHIAGTCVVKAQ